MEPRSFFVFAFMLHKAKVLRKVYVKNCLVVSQDKDEPRLSFRLAKLKEDCPKLSKLSEVIKSDLLQGSNFSLIPKTHTMFLGLN